ncbi:MAG: GGDEF domain-containing protein [Lachnospiraceae bacterium]|nr:GGDEF domain-containing protein [Lachnospiraceae bacterium]
MTKIAFLITEIASERTKRILQGAVQEAGAQDAVLFVYPGRYLVSSGREETEHPDMYQETAVFDYTDPANTDVIILDAKEICKHATARKREKFLSAFADGRKVLTLTETEGFACVMRKESGKYEQLGENAVRDAVRMARTKVQKEEPDAEAAEEAESAEIKKPSGNGSAMDVLSRASHALLHHSYHADANPYDTILRQTLAFGAHYAALYLFRDAVANTDSAPWEIPSDMLRISMIRKGKRAGIREAKSVRTKDVLKPFTGLTDAHAFILNNLFLNDRQVGLLVTELTPQLMVPYVNSQFASLVTGAVRLIAGDQQLLKAQDEIRANKRTMDKDQSVLERLGDEDYLTKRLNRRGFFAQAYDLLQKSFREGTFAIVGYIDMDSIKSINENFGREAGDAAVRRVADLLSGVFGRESILGRIRGNEFAVLLVTEDEGEADRLKDEMALQNLRLMEEKDERYPYIIHLQFSICAFRYREHLSLKEMLAQTDDNLQKVRQM